MGRRRPPTTISASHSTTQLEEYRRGWSQARWAEEASRTAAPTPEAAPSPATPEISRRANRSIPKGLQGRLTTAAPARDGGELAARTEEERVVADVIDELLRKAEL